jgi:hypothetical protein
MLPEFSWPPGTRLTDSLSSYEKQAEESQAQFPGMAKQEAHRGGFRRAPVNRVFAHSFLCTPADARWQAELMGGEDGR